MTSTIRRRVSGTPKLHIRMISGGMCDTKVRGNVCYRPQTLEQCRNKRLDSFKFVKQSYEV